MAIPWYTRPEIVVDILDAFSSMRRLLYPTISMMQRACLAFFLWSFQYGELVHSTLKCLPVKLTPRIMRSLNGCANLIHLKDDKRALFCLESGMSYITISTTAVNQCLAVMLNEVI